MRDYNVALFGRRTDASTSDLALAGYRAQPYREGGVSAFPIFRLDLRSFRLGRRNRFGDLADRFGRKLLGRRGELVTEFLVHVRSLDQGVNGVQHSLGLSNRGFRIVRGDANEASIQEDEPSAIASAKKNYDFCHNAHSFLTFMEPKTLFGPVE